MVTLKIWLSIEEPTSEGHMKAFSSKSFRATDLYKRGNQFQQQVCQNTRVQVLVKMFMHKTDDKVFF